MKTLTFNGRDYPLDEHESVLDCLLRHGQAIPYACKAGMCQACLVRAVDCEATAESSKWVKPTLRAQGFTLACQWVPQTDISAELPRVEDFSVEVRIRRLQPLNARVMQVRLEPARTGEMFTYRPGQYLTLINPAGVARSYSIANDFETDGFIELHIGNTTHGVFTHWLFNEAQAGTTLFMRGPAGDCYYLPADAGEMPLLLAATGTGLAPLYGIARDALARGHEQPINLFHGGRGPEQLYYREELQALSASHANFNYYPCAKDPGDDTACEAGSLEEVLGRQLADSTLTRSKIYLCGAPDFVYDLRKTLYLQGVRIANILCDPFTERTVARK